MSQTMPLPPLWFPESDEEITLPALERCEAMIEENQEAIIQKKFQEYLAEAQEEAKDYHDVIVAAEKYATAKFIPELVAQTVFPGNTSKQDHLTFRMYRGLAKELMLVLWMKCRAFAIEECHACLNFRGTGHGEGCCMDDTAAIDQYFQRAAISLAFPLRGLQQMKGVMQSMHSRTFAAISQTAIDRIQEEPDKINCGDNEDLEHDLSDIASNGH